MAADNSDASQDERCANIRATQKPVTSTHCGLGVPAGSIEFLKFPEFLAVSLTCN